MEVDVSYRKEQVEFVSNLSGGAVEDIILVLVHVPILVSILRFLRNPSHPSLLLSYMVVVIPTVLVLTVWSPYSFYTFLSTSGILLVLSATRSTAVSIPDCDSTPPQTNHITLFKGANVLLTCICILAVDFHIFPRYYAKTELFGESLMDLGTGSFIVSSALTSQFARTGSVDGTHFLSWKRLIVLALALSRTLSIKLLGYQEHVSEYGIHWNFFATLYFVWGISDLVHRLIPSKLIIIVAIGGIALYQYAIIQFDIAHYVLSDDRVGFFAENKEGILSLAGYGALYLISEGVAKAMFYSTDKQDASTLRTNMLLFSLFAWVGWYLAAVFVQPTSRRLCNLTYTLLTVAICWSVLMGFYVLGSVGKGRDVILSSFSASSLPIFLLANVMTGGVNMSIRTLHTEPSTALAILLLYGLVLSAVAWGYHGYRHPVRMAGGQSGPT